MPKNHNILDCEASVLHWFAKTKFHGDLQASRKFMAEWRFTWNKNGNRFKTGDLVFESHKNEVLEFLALGASIAQIKSKFRISINHIKRVLIELTSEKKIDRRRQGKAYVYFHFGSKLAKQYDKKHKKIKREILKINKAKIKNKK